MERYRVIEGGLVISDGTREMMAEWSGEVGSLYAVPREALENCIRKTRGWHSLQNT
jgi:hypothetical protein